MVRGADHIADVSQDIYDGGLSRYLVYPTSYFRFKYAQHVGLMVPALVQVVLFVVFYVVLFTQPAEARVTPASVLMAAGSVALANVLFYVLHMPIQMVAFWADNVWSLVVMLRFAASLLGGAMLPLALFPAWSQRLLAWLPFRYLFDFPVNTLIGRVTPGEWLANVAVALLWVTLVSGATLVVWRRGVRSYTGVGI
jgi:ABC-2 type transport system permease protein